LATGNGRIYIWQATQRQLEHSDIFHLLFGFGADGQVTSGASLQYAYLFEGTPNPLLVHVHNLALQTLLDMGIVGLVLLVVTVVIAIARPEATNRLSPGGPVAVLLAGALMLFVTGATETSPTYRTQDTLVFAMLLFSVSAGLAMQPIEIPARRRPQVVVGRPTTAVRGVRV
jgi:O-antigen ligase